MPFYFLSCSVFAVAVVLLVVGQAVVVCRQRHGRRTSCRRRRKWNVPVFDAGGLAGASLHGGGGAAAAAEVWTALPSDLFHADHYRTPAFAYINRRSTDSLPALQHATHVSRVFPPRFSAAVPRCMGPQIAASPPRNLAVLLTHIGHY